MQIRETSFSAIDDAVVGNSLSASGDPVVSGLSTIFTELDTSMTYNTDKVQIIKTDAGKMMYVATRVEGTSWVVASATPYSFVMDPTYASLNVSLLITLVSLAGLAAFLFFVIKKYLEPVSVVTGRIGDITGGDFTAKVDAQGNNEITTLSEQLNDYIERMKGMLLHITEISEDMSGSAQQCLDISGSLSRSNAS